VAQQRQARRQRAQQLKCSDCCHRRWERAVHACCALPGTGPKEPDRTFSVCQLPSGWCVSTDSEPSEDAAATTRPSSCGANETLFTDDV